MSQQENNKEENQHVQEYFNNKPLSKDEANVALVPQSQLKQEIEIGETRINLRTGKRNSFSKLIHDDSFQFRSQNQTKKMKIKKNLDFLNRQYRIGTRIKEKSQNQQTDKDLVVFSRQEHKEFMRKVAKKEQSIGMVRDKREKLKIQKQTSEKEKLKKQQEEQKERSILKQQQIQEKIKETKQKLQEKFKKDQEVNKVINELKQKKYLHNKMEEHYENQIVLPILEQKNKKLKQIHDFKKPIDFDQLKIHQEEYIKKRQHGLQTSQAKFKNQPQYKKPHKSQNLLKILEQEQTKQKLTVEEKKRDLEQRLRKRQQFLAQIKDKNSPTVSKKKRDEITSRFQSKHRQIGDSREIGLSYLHTVGRKKKSTHSQINIKYKQTQSNTSYTNYLKPDRSMEEYEQIRKKQIQKIMSSNIDNNEKLKIIKNQVERLQQNVSRKEQVMKAKNKGGYQGMLVANIQAKMDLMLMLYNQ